jgi:hypothetical protein
MSKINQSIFNKLITMKIKFYLIGIILILPGVILAQQSPTGSPVPSGYSTAQQAASAWYRGGNNFGNTGAYNNILGTAWNSPIYFTTAGTTSPFYRMKLNGDVSYSVAASNQARNGYLLLGSDAPLYSGGPTELYSNYGAFSLLHLNGNNGTFTQYFGHRSWMKTGITFTDNNDLSYFGLRKLGTGTDITETALVWGDNSGTNSGPDDFTLRFITGDNSETIGTDLFMDYDADGLQVGRFTGTGQFALGNTFGVNATGTPSGLYIRPQSLFHMSYEFRTGSANQSYGYQQITYRKPTAQSVDIIGQGEAATDGLRFGIDNTVYTGGPNNYLNSYLRWQEASSFIIQTEDDLIPNISSNERLRVTSIGALNATQNTILYDGLTTSTNATRISMSESGATPLQRPKSLLHLGYDYGGLLAVQGYRKWMDLGVLTSNNKDHVWFGLKPRTALTTTVSATYDQLDAVVAWGTDRQAASAAAVDNMRFIFTGHTFDANPDGAPSVSADGLEMMRLYPATKYSHPIYNSSGVIVDSTLAYGRVGIGDFTVSGVGQEPTHKLDVVGNGRFRYLPDSVFKADTLVKKIVMVDENGVLRWSNSIPDAFGAACSDNINGKLDFDTKVDLNDHNLYFTRNDSIGANKMGIGYNCGTTLEAKLNVFSKNETWSGSFYVDGNSPVDVSGNSHQGGLKSIIDSTTTKNATAIYGYVAPNTTIPMDAQIGVKGKVDGRTAKEAIGVFGESSVLTPTSASLGGRFLSSGSAVGRAVQAQNYTVQTSGPNSGFGFGGDFNSSSTSGQTVNSNTGVNGSANGNATLNTGVRGLASGNGTTNIGLYGQATNGGINWAAYLDGNIYHGGLVSGPSDQMLKENVVTIENADSLINLLNPVTFDFKTDDYPQLNLLPENQMGLIAQQVETVFPNIVKENMSPAIYDSVGTIVHPSVTFKTVDYTKLIPVLISGHKEQTAEIQAKDSIIDSLQAQVADLNNRLTQLENCLSGILPLLCQLSQSAIQANTPAAQEEVRKNLNVTLSNRSAIVLDQNVPNPFAEQTTINFSIPETVKKAQIHFYDGNGRFMNSVEVTERGLGSITVFGSDLSTGVYTYTLVADGQVVATKKMMKQ